MITFEYRIELDYAQILRLMCRLLKKWYRETDYNKINKNDIESALLYAINTDYDLQEFDNFDENFEIITQELKTYIKENNIEGELEQTIGHLL